MRAPGVRQARWKNGVLNLRVGAGHYEFHAPSKAPVPQPRG